MVASGARAGGKGTNQGLELRRPILYLLSMGLGWLATPEMLDGVSAAAIKDCTIDETLT